MAQFKIGDLVECVCAKRAGPPEKYDPPPLVEGALYRVVGTGVIGYPCSLTGCPTIVVAEVKSRLGDGFLARRFRLIHRPRADFIEALKALPAEPEAVSA